MAARTLISVCAALLLILPALAQADPGEPGRERVTESVYDGQGRLVIERGLVEGSDGLVFERRYWYADPSGDAAKPDNPGNGNGGGNGGGKGGDDGGDDGGADPGTDCASDKYAEAGWRWTGAYSAYASSHASVFDAAGEAWDAATGADIFGSVTSGSPGVAGEQDFVNQIDFADLGASTTIAVTTTWYYRGSGEAVESDAQYNTYYAWSTSGEAGAMDVLNIATHEIGHTFGLTHPNGPSHKIGCLTMYAYASEGETQKQTLGDGDILGIQALYGA